MRKRIIAAVLAFAMLLPLGLVPGYAGANSPDGLLGIWRGTYYNNIGLNGYEFIVFMDGNNPRAVVHFFPVPGSPPGQGAGSTLNEVLFDPATGRFEFVPIEYLDMPPGWSASGQGGVLDGNVLTGNIRNSPELTFRVYRVSSSNFGLDLRHEHLMTAGICIFCGASEQESEEPAPAVHTFTPFVLRHAPISQQGRQRAEDFLSQFPTVFLEVPWFQRVDGTTGNVYDWDGSRVQNVPLYFRDAHGNLHRQDGTAVGEDAPYISHGAVATRFNLFNLDDSGTPVITILFTFETWGWHAIYRFVNGEYRHMGSFSWPRFRTDTFGHLIMASNEAGASSQYDGLHYVVWDGADMQLQTIIGFAGEDWTDFVWHNFITGQPSDFSFYIDNELNPPGVPGTPFTTVNPLTALEDEITAALTARLLVPDGIVLRFYSDPFADVTGYYADLSVRQVTVREENWLEAAAEQLDFPVRDIRLVGNRLYVDLMQSAEQTHLQGTSGAAAATNSLFMSLASFPGVEWIVVLLGGERDRWGDHFSFEGMVQVTGIEADRIWEQAWANVAGRLRWVDYAPLDAGIYVHLPTPAAGQFRPGPLPQTNSVQTANSHIQTTVQFLTPAQRQSPEALNILALYVENVARIGTTQDLPTNGSLNAQMLQAGAAAAGQMRQNTHAVLAQENISLLRHLRANLNFAAPGADEVTVAFPDAVSGIAFDNVTIEADFAAITLNRGSISVGNEITIRQAQADVQEEEENEEDAEAAGQNGPDNPLRNFVDAITDFSSPLTILFNFWWALACALFIGTWFVLAHFGKRLRRWVVPTFSGLAFCINIGLILLLSGGGIDDGMPGLAEQEQDNYAQRVDLQANTIEVVMDEGMFATLSIPINGINSNPHYLILFNQQGEAQHSRFNPVTRSIDANIRTGGIFYLRERNVSFNDIAEKSPVVQEAATRLAAHGIMRGDGAGGFNPDAGITRAQFVAAIVLAFDMLDPNAQNRFDDLSPSDWYYHAIATAHNENIVAGFDDNTFRGDLEMPKDQMITLAANLLAARIGYTMPDGSHADSILAAYLDQDLLAQWARRPVALATAENILPMRQDSLFAPQSVMTRGDAAVVIYRLLNRIW